MADYCRSCGKALNKNSKKCPECGTVNDVKRRPVVPIIICVVLVLAVSVGAYLFVKGKDDKPSAESTEPSSSAVSQPQTENAELKQLVRDGNAPSHINALGKDMLKSMISSAQTLSYAEISEEQFSKRVSLIVGSEIKPDENAFSESVAEDKDFYYADAGSEDGRMYLVFGKKDRNMYILSELENGYWLTQRVESKAVADRFLGKEQKKSEAHYVLGETGETVFFGITVGNWCLYYNDEGDLFVCMNNADEANPLFFNGSYESMEPFAGHLVFQTVLDNIETKYSKKLIF